MARLYELMPYIALSLQLLIFTQMTVFYINECFYFQLLRKVLYKLHDKLIKKQSKQK